MIIWSQLICDGHHSSAAPHSDHAMCGPTPILNCRVHKASTGKSEGALGGSNGKAAVQAAVHVPSAARRSDVQLDRESDDDDDDDDGDDYPAGRYTAGGTLLQQADRAINGRPFGSRPLSGQSVPSHFGMHETVHVARPGSAAAMGGVERAALRAAAAAAASVARNSGQPTNAKYQW